MASRTEFDVPAAEGAGAIAENAVSANATGRALTISTVTLLTVTAAVLAYAREATLAARFGVSATMDAYFGAIFIPANIYLILVGGAVSPIFIPILLQDGGNVRDRTSEVFSMVTNFVLILFAAVVIAGMATARWWMGLLFPGFEPTTQAEAIKLVYIIFPALPLLALAGVLTAALNAFHKYSMAAFAPALLSISVILSALLAHGSRVIYIVGLGTAAGFLLQFLVLVPATWNLGIRYRFQFRFRDPAIARLVRLGSPLLLYLLLANATPVIERNLASTLSPGALSTITYATRLFTVPANFLVSPLVIVSYPYLARAAMTTDHEELRQEIARTTRWLLFLFIPISMWLVVNAEPITSALYERGHFGPADSLVVSRVFSLYTIGILANAIAVLLLRAFYAVQDTFTPLWAEAIDLVFFIAAAPWMTRHFGISGLAISRGATFVLVAIILVWVLWRRRLLICDRELGRFLLWVLLATLAMGSVSWCGLRVFHSWLAHAITLERAGAVLAQFALDAALFLALAFVLKIPEAKRSYSIAVELLRRMKKANRVFRQLATNPGRHE